MLFYSSSAPAAAFLGSFIRNYSHSGACISFHDIRSSCIPPAFGTVSIGAPRAHGMSQRVWDALPSNQSEVQVSLQLWVDLRPTTFPYLHAYIIAE
ncbi:hypothetical protein R3P38DRAFT_3201521 [Favolaschia claudopus]|uniref:Uncharacterized protein n=1 Tax=Favolaschia claudopus TaxID=2862362 RepID=A0AAW0AXY0_9AGAR